MQIMQHSSTQTSSRPMLMPACSGMNSVFERVAFERGERGARVGGGVDADAEPRHAVAAEDAQNGAGQDHQHLRNGFVLQPGEIINHAQRDEHPERGEEFPLLEQIRLAGFPDDVGDLAHGPVDRQRAGLGVFQKSERRADGADGQPQNKMAWLLTAPSSNDESSSGGR